MQLSEDIRKKVILFQQTEITENVLKAMELDRERRIQLVRKYVPAVLHKQFYHFAGLSPDSPNGLPHLDNRRYWFFILQKE